MRVDPVSYIITPPPGGRTEQHVTPLKSPDWTALRPLIVLCVTNSEIRRFSRTRGRQRLCLTKGLNHTTYRTVAQSINYSSASKNTHVVPFDKRPVRDHTQADAGIYTSSIFNPCSVEDFCIWLETKCEVI